MAQETTTNPTAAGDKAEKREKRFKGGRRGFGGHEMRGRFGGFGLRGIELTDAQKGQIKSIREANRPDPAIHAELKAIRDSRKAGQQITADQKARLQAIREQRMNKARSVHEQILAILTPEQKTQLETRRNEMRQRFENRHNKVRDDVRDRKGRPDAPTTDKPKTI